MICVDVLDVWAVPAVLRWSGRGTTVHYLIVHPGWRGAFVLWLVRFFGRTPSRLASCFEANRPGLYPEFHREALEFLLKHIEPIWRAQIAGWHGQSDDEKSRLARYATIQSWGWLSRMFELLLSMPSTPSTHGMVLLQHSPALSGIKAYARARGIGVHSYSAAGRLWMPVRKEYYGDHSRVSPSILASLAVYMAVIASLVPGMIGAMWRVLCQIGGTGQHERYDVLALAYQAEPTPGFNDLFWAEHLHRQYGRRVFAVHARPFHDRTRQFYLQRAQRLQSIRRLAVFFFQFRDNGASRAAGDYLRGVFRALVVINVRLFSGGLSVWLAATWLRVECRTRFFTALMRASGARIAWAMLEGNEINTLSMTLAAGRVGGICFGASWSLPYSPTIVFSLARNHVLFTWGLRQKKVCVQSGALIQRYVMSGYPTVGRYLKKQKGPTSRPLWLTSALERGRRKKVVTFFDNICAADIIISCDEMRTLFSTLLKWVAERTDVLLVLKTKRKGPNALGVDILMAINALEREGIVLVREEKADLEAGLVADVVLGISSSTLACLSAAYGKRCVLYDLHGVVSDNAYPLGLSSVLRIGNPAEIAAALDRALDMTSDCEIRGGFVDAFADAEGERRIAFYLNATLAALDGGCDIQTAEAEVTRRYIERWPEAEA